MSKLNQSNQSAYDVSESHTVRQYLLPMVFQSERHAGTSAVGMDASQPYAHNVLPSTVGHPSMGVPPTAYAPSSANSAVSIAPPPTIPLQYGQLGSASVPPMGASNQSTVRKFQPGKLWIFMVILMLTLEIFRLTQ